MIQPKVGYCVGHPAREVRDAVFLPFLERDTRV